MANMKRIHAFVIGVLALFVAALVFLGLTLAPPCVYGPLVPKQYPVFVFGFSTSHVFTIIIFGIAGIKALSHALRED